MREPLSKEESRMEIAKAEGWDNDPTGSTHIPALKAANLDLDLWLARNLFCIKAKKLGNYWTLVDADGEDIAGLEERNAEMCWHCKSFQYTNSNDAQLVLRKIAEKLGNTAQFYYIAKENLWWWNPPNRQKFDPIPTAPTLEMAICQFAFQLFKE